MPIKRIAKGVYYVVLAGLIAVALLLIVSAFPITGSFKVYAVLSGSMEPAIHTGSVVVVRSASAYKIGDVITFKGTGKEISVTHRIHEMRVDLGEPVYITKGDANNAPDSRQIRAGDIIGRQLVAIPYAGYAVEAARTRYGFIALVALPAAVIILEQAMSIWREAKKIRAKRGIPSTSSGSSV